MSPRRLPIFAAVAALAGPTALVACTNQTNDNFTNPVPGPPSTCAVSSAIAGCAGGSVGYSCTSSRPDDGDTNLVCSDGLPGADGSTLYCCAPYGQYFSDCTTDTTIAGCGANSVGFACTGPTSPDEADSSLVCSPGVAGDGKTVYCCTSGPIAPGCATDSALTTCQGVAIAYSCGGTDAPNLNDTALVCSIGAASDGSTDYCCIPFAQSTGGCVEDDTVAGCAAGSYGFSCVSGSTPSAVEPTLQCGAGTPGSDGASLYCCHNG